MIEVYGLVPEYSGRGRPPTHKQAGADWLHLQMVKQRDDQVILLERNSKPSLAVWKN